MKAYVRQKDIAELCGVSQTTVSRALKNDTRIAPEVRERVHQMSRKMGYVLNPAMQALAGHRWTPEKVSLPNIAAIHEVPDNRPSNERASYMISYSKELGYHMSVFALSQYRRRDNLRRALHARGIRGLIFDSWRQDCGNAEEWSDFACIVVGSRFVPSPFDSVIFDHYHSLRTGLQEMLQRGYQRIGFILFRSPSARDDDMRNGAIEGMRQRQPEKIFPTLFLESFAGEPIPQVQAYLDEHQPDGLVIFNDFLRQTLRKMNVRIPEDLGVFVLHEPEPDARSTAACPFFDERILSQVAVDRLHSALQTGQRGVPEYPCTVNVALKDFNWASLPQRNRVSG